MLVLGVLVMFSSDIFAAWKSHRVDVVTRECVQGGVSYNATLAQEKRLPYDAIVAACVVKRDTDH